MSGPAFGALAVAVLLLLVALHDYIRMRPEWPVALVGALVSFAVFVGTQLS